MSPFLFSSRRRHTRWTGDWSSDVCSSDLSYDIPPVDYSTVMRLAEVYLNRAESRVHLNKLEDALSDINIIRSRAGLPAANLRSEERRVGKECRYRGWR